MNSAPAGRSRAPTLKHRLLQAAMALGVLAGISAAMRGDGVAEQSVLLDLEIPSRARAGEVVPLTLRLRNTGPSPVEITLGGNPPHDFLIRGGDGSEVWRWTHGQVIQAILQVKTLRPGQVLRFRAEWPQRDNGGRPVPSGSYLVLGILNLEPPQKMETTGGRLTIAP